MDNPKYMITYIGCRISYNEFITKEVNKKFDEEKKKLERDGKEEMVSIRMQNYLYIKEQSCGAFLGNIQLLAVQIDSTPLMFRENFEPKIDILILDELKSLFRYLSAKHIAKRRTEIVDSFMNLIRNAQHIKVLDADFDQPALDVLLHILKDEKMDIYISVNTYKNDERTYLVYQDSYDAEQLILEKIDKNLKFAIAVNTLKKGDKMERMIIAKAPNCRYLWINSRVLKSLDSNKRKEYLDKDYWKREGYQVIIYSPTITMGFDVNERDYWNCVFGFFSFKSNTGAECNQMIQRFRYLVSKEVHLCITSGKSKFVKNQPFDYETTRKKLLNSLTFRFYEIERKIRTSGHLGDVESVVNEVIASADFGLYEDQNERIHYQSGWQRYITGKRAEQYLNSDYVTVLIHNLIERRMSSSNFKDEFFRILGLYLIDGEDQIIQVPKRNNITKYQRRQESKENKEDAGKNEAQLIVDARTVPFHYWSPNKTQEDVYAFKKLDVKAFFRLNYIDANFVTEWKSRIPQIYAIEILFFTEKGQSVTLEERLYEDCPQIRFLDKNRELWHNLARVCGINPNRILDYKYDHNEMVDYGVLNMLLKNANLKKGELSITQIHDNDDKKSLRKLIRELLDFIGIEFESKQKEGPKHKNGKRNRWSEYYVCYETLAKIIGVMIQYRHWKNPTMLSKLQEWERILKEKHGLTCVAPQIIPPPPPQPIYDDVDERLRHPAKFFELFGKDFRSSIPQPENELVASLTSKLINDDEEEV
jgi:hypothetical protein